ncbi:hypothetical protein ACROYT_G013212 [Oculina patagonica]
MITGRCNKPLEQPENSSECTTPPSSKRPSALRSPKGSYIQWRVPFYGEVFTVEYRDGRSAVLRLIPVEGEFIVFRSPQKTFEEILPEILIFKELSLLGDVKKNDTPMDNMSKTFVTLHRLVTIV